MTKALLYLLLFLVSWPVAIAVVICYVLYVACSLTVKIIFYMTKGGLTATAAYIKARDDSEEAAAKRKADPQAVRPNPVKKGGPTFVNERGQVVR